MCLKRMGAYRKIVVQPNDMVALSGIAGSFAVYDVEKTLARA